MKSIEFSNAETELVLGILRNVHAEDSEAADFYDAVIESGVEPLFDAQEHEAARKSATMLADIIERLSE